MDLNQYETCVTNGLECESYDLKYNLLITRTKQLLEHKYELIQILPIFLKHYRLFKPCHFGLIDLIFDRINWLKDDKIYEEFILKIISESSFTEICVYHLLKALKPQFIIDPTNKNDTKMGKAELIKTLKFDYKLSVAIAKKVHELLKKILNFVPTAISLLLKLIDNLYPVPSSDTIYHSWYVKNLLQISNWCQITRKAVYSSIFSSLLKIDALEDIADDEEEENHRDQYAVDLDDENEEEEESSIHNSHSFDNIHKAESILLQIITHLDNMDINCFDDKYFFDLLFIFEERIINSLHSRNAQFVLFYFCTKRSDYYPQKFMAYLLNKIIRTNSPTQSRIAAMGCLSSFVVRFAKIPSNLIVECFDLLIKWSIDYTEKNSKNNTTQYNTPPDVTAHSIYYALCQCIIYIYIWKSNILTSQHNSQELQNNFRKIIIHHFNPLIVCKRRVVEEFIKITSRKNICKELESYYNEISNVLSHVKFDTKFNFHFDPLEDSKCFDLYISKHYNTWEDINDYEDESDDDLKNNMSENSYNSFNEPSSLIPKNESSLNFEIDANIDL